MRILMPGKRIPCVINASRNDTRGPLEPMGLRLLNQEIISSDNCVNGCHQGPESNGSSVACQRLSSVRIAQENGVVEIEHQACGVTTQHRQLPRLQQLALKN